MKNGIAVLTLAAVVAGAGVSAHADDNFRLRSLAKTVMSGVHTKFDQVIHFNRDCSIIDLPAVHIVQPPAHGRLEVAHQPIFPSTHAEPQRCQSVKMMGTVVYYTAKAGYTGKDTIVIRSPFDNGKIQDTTFNVTVLK